MWYIATKKREENWGVFHPPPNNSNMMLVSRNKFRNKILVSYPLSYFLHSTVLVLSGSDNLSRVFWLFYQKNLVMGSINILGILLV